ncbi:MAG: hypothetical protein ACRDWS_01490 [Acidimicrobiia bacterium]
MSPREYPGGGHDDVWAQPLTVSKYDVGAVEPGEFSNDVQVTGLQMSDEALVTATVTPVIRSRR